MISALGVPTDPAFLLNGWAVVVFLVLLLAVGVPVAFVKGWIYTSATVEAERRRGDMLQTALDNDRVADRKKDEALIELLALSRTIAAALERLQDERDAAYLRERERMSGRGGTTTTDLGARR